MTTADQIAIVNQTLLSEDEKSVVFADGGLVKDWNKCRRLIVIVGKSENSHALFVYSVKNGLPISNVSDLDLETVLPIDENFRCAIDSNEADVLYLSINEGQPNKLKLEMTPGFHTNSLISEIFQLSDSAKSDKNFDWLKKYTKDVVKMDQLSLDQQQTSLSASKSSTSLTSVDSEMSRHELASGGGIVASEDVFNRQMALREDQYTELHHFTVFCGTWNVNGRNAQNDLREWLAIDSEPPDLYAVGFQELDLSTEALILTKSPREEEWLKAVTQSLHPKAKYKKGHLLRLTGIMLIVYFKEEHAPFIKEISANYVGTGGLGNFDLGLGNKGGVAIRLRFHNTSICFVNSHLAAHVNEVERRNQDFHGIHERILFSEETLTRRSMYPPKRIPGHDVIYWIGDLNYRISNMDASEVKDCIREGRIEELKKNDQLVQQKNQRKVFHGYEEGPIGFLPSYKFDPGTDVWDTSEKSRPPAWTDRVLWRGKHIEQLNYRCHMELKISDHKPVSALFRTGIKVIQREKEKKVKEDVRKELDKLENEFLPQVEVDTTEINFDIVRFLEEQTQTLTVANTGQVPVEFEFIKKPGEKSICRPWLTVFPSNGFINIGDKVDVTLRIKVDENTAGPLTCGKEIINDILVLHMINGKDIFITISGEYQRSCFGASINALVRMTVPISEISISSILQLEGTTKKQPDLTNSEKITQDPYPVPKELWFLCDLITSLGLERENLFLRPGLGLHSEIILLRKWLDTGLPVTKPDVSIHSAADTLLLFLESLREPVIPNSKYNQCLGYAGNYLQCRQIISQLTLHHREVFNYVCEFLREVLRYSATNKTNVASLSRLFAAILLRNPPGSGSDEFKRRQQESLRDQKAKFLQQFLMNETNVVISE